MLKFIFALVLFSGPFLILHAHQEDNEERLQWSEEKLKAANIQIQVASPGMIQNFVRVPGKVVNHPDCIAYVIPKASGSVKEVRKNLGDRVEKNEILAVLESKEMAEAKSNYLAALKKWDLRCTLLQREEELRGISPEQDYLNAKLAAEEALIDVDLAAQSLYALGLTKTEVNKIPQASQADLRFYEITSPIKGNVSQRNLTVGELINNDNKVYTIVDFEKVWIEMSVCQNNLQYLKRGLPVEVIAADGKKIATQIAQICPSISEETRAATAIAMIENKAEKWAPGEFVTASIQTDRAKCGIVVPRESIQNIDGENYIFVEEENSFIPRVVTLGKMEEKNAEILSGLKAGEKYAASNTFLLKAEFEKDEAEHSHP